jgi:formate-dependent nitrite reductase cytochrome c552 subunit
MQWRPGSWLAFGLTLAASLAAGAAYGLAQPAAASPAIAPVGQGTGYAGPDSCAVCHQEIHALWQNTRHAQAFSSPIFQQNWEEIGGEFTCLQCHTTGYDPAINFYYSEGVTCESCHGPLQPGHPEVRMPIAADAELCATCHKTTTDEWRASQHGEVGIQCQSCHDPHAQQPRAESVTALCGNCHKDTGTSFTHGTHADAGLECSNCHMFTDPRTSPPIEGLVPTGHTFSVGSQACIGCHQDSVHTRDTILQLSGEVSSLEQLDLDELRQHAQQQQQAIADLQARSSTRLYVGLAQGGIVGLATGSVAAWVVSRKLKIVELEEDRAEDGEEEDAS